MTQSLSHRTCSSPNLTDHKHWQCQSDKYYDRYGAEEEEDEDDEEFYVIGDRVYLDKYRAASVAYFGEVDFAPGSDWVGLVLDEPTGGHNGRVQGREYFQCGPFQGTFVRAHRLSRMSGRSSDSALGSSTSERTSRSATPLPTLQSLRMSPAHWAAAAAGGGRRSKSPATSVGSYYYDDDYRQPEGPSVASLTRKLKSIDEQYGGEPVKTAAPSSTGILKGNQARPESTSIGARAEELSRRIRAASSERLSPSVFNFRPKREQLDDFLAPPTTDGRRSVNLASEPARKGDRVLVRTERGGHLSGILRFMGETEFATGEWAGVELDHPEGKNDGQVLGVRYFHCPKGYGLFVPATRVTKASMATPDYDSRITTTRGTEPSSFGGVKSTIWSPPPPPPLADQNNRHPYWSSSPARDYLSSTPSSALSSHSPSSPFLDDHIYDPYNNDTKLSATSRTNLNGDYLNSRLNYADDICRMGNRERPKFDDKDLELQLKKSLSRRPSSYVRGTVTSREIDQARPKAVRYTFTSSKYDGNPIARRTLLYD